MLESGFTILFLSCKLTNNYFLKENPLEILFANFLVHYSLVFFQKILPKGMY